MALSLLLAHFGVTSATIRVVIGTKNRPFYFPSCFFLPFLFQTCFCNEYRMKDVAHSTESWTSALLGGSCMRTVPPSLFLSLRYEGDRNDCEGPTSFDDSHMCIYVMIAI